MSRENVRPPLRPTTTVQLSYSDPGDPQNIGNKDPSLAAYVDWPARGSPFSLSSRRASSKRANALENELENELNNELDALVEGIELTTHSNRRRATLSKFAPTTRWSEAPLQPHAEDAALARQMCESATNDFNHTYENLTVAQQKQLRECTNFLEQIEINPSNVAGSEIVYEKVYGAAIANYDEELQAAEIARLKKEYLCKKQIILDEQVQFAWTQILFEAQQEWAKNLKDECANDENCPQAQTHLQEVVSARKECEKATLEFEKRSQKLTKNNTNKLQNHVQFAKKVYDSSSSQNRNFYTKFLKLSIAKLDKCIQAAESARVKKKYFCYMDAQLQLPKIQLLIQTYFQWLQKPRDQHFREKKCRWFFIEHFYPFHEKDLKDVRKELFSRDIRKVGALKKQLQKDYDKKYAKLTPDQKIEFDDHGKNLKDRLTLTGFDAYKFSYDLIRNLYLTPQQKDANVARVRVHASEFVMNKDCGMPWDFMLLPRTDRERVRGLVKLNNAAFDERVEDYIQRKLQRRSATAQELRRTLQVKNARKASSSGVRRGNGASPAAPTHDQGGTPTQKNRARRPLLPRTGSSPSKKKQRTNDSTRPNPPPPSPPMIAKGSTLPDNGSLPPSSSPTVATGTKTPSRALTKAP